jgi:D-arabinose 1-dehydrogenase-like Zn-dependent alcohol dehydrogenase
VQKNTDMVLGHEGVGVVEALGPDCKLLRKGDRVGWGYEHDSCGHCRQCLTGTEQYCNDRQMYAAADLDQGSFASHAVWREAFLFKIPDGLSDEEAAPFQCAGATVWTALMAYNTRPTETVGIMGVGGLGHIAIQFARAMGARVVVLSGSDSKKDEAIRLGAHEFIATKGQKKLETARKLDRLLVTTSAQPDWNLLMPIMAAGSTIHPLSVSSGDFSIPYMAMLASGITVQGSVVAARQMHKDSKRNPRLLAGSSQNPLPIVRADQTADVATFFSLPDSARVCGAAPDQARHPDLPYDRGGDHRGHAKARPWRGALPGCHRAPVDKSPTTFMCLFISR